MSARMDKLLAEIRDVVYTQGPSELDLVEATYMNRDKGLLFGKPNVAAIALRAWAVLPIGYSRSSAQYYIIGNTSAHMSIVKGEFVLVAYDAQLRMGSMALLKDFNEGLDLLKKLVIFKLPFDVTSPFDGIVLTKLKEAEKTLTYDELRRRTRIKRGLPDILLRLERQNFLTCTRENEHITHVGLTD